jgi:outer membrane receptor for ferrienterochelin and colicin
MLLRKKNALLILFLLLNKQVSLFSQSSIGAITGIVTEKSDGLPIPGVNVVVKGIARGTVTDVNGKYSIDGVEPGRYSITFSFISYKPVEISNAEVKKGTISQIDAELEEESVVLNDVVVVAARKTDSEISVINQIRENTSIVNGISAQLISKSQDRDASEVVKRVPGISIMNDKFLVVRGLSQRYNNVWLNDTPTPGVETDTRAFGFDVIPGSQIDNIIIFKSPSPELPADFSGGFVKILTKSRADKNSFIFQYGTAFLEGTTFKPTYLPRESFSDYLGFYNGGRSLPANFPENLQNVSVAKCVAFTKAMDNDWTPVKGNAFPDQKISLVYSHNYPGRKSFSASNFASLSYNISSKSLEIQNKRFGIYDITSQTSSLYNDFNDTKYLRDVKIAMLYNWVLNFSKKFKLDIRNLYNQIGQSSYTSRSGSESYSGEYQIKGYSDQYFTRSIYSGQIAGDHIIGDGSQTLNWTVGYSRASRNTPDRRIVTARRNMDYDTTSTFGNFRTESNDIKRLYQNLFENTFSGGLCYKYKSDDTKRLTEFLAGWYGEYRTRDFSSRSFSYDNGGGLSSDFYNLPVNEMLTDLYINEDGIYISEDTNKSDSYSANNLLQAGYLSSTFKIGRRISITPGLRVEYNRMILNGYESDGIKPVTVTDEYVDFFPSINSTIRINEKNQLRIAYGKSVNRPEFREIAPYVFYDYDAYSYFEGNPDLKSAHISNYEIRYEYYPQTDEIITAGVFYKKFRDPIEMTYYDAGGTLQYTYANAESAVAKGMEIDVRKSLEFIGLKSLSLTFNGAWIYSRIQFTDKSIERNRAMEGQSPYVLNAGLFYTDKTDRYSFGINYNCIGKRIIAVGQVYQNSNENIPDTYEMPRDLLNLSFTWKLTKKLEMALYAKDILNEKAENKQFIHIVSDEVIINKTQVTKSYSPGSYFGITLNYKID